MSSANADIKNAIDSFDIDKARALLRDALKEADGETYYLASQVALNENQKREFLQKAIDRDPFHIEAHKALEAMRNGVAAFEPPKPAAAVVQVPAVAPVVQTPPAPPAPAAPPPQKVEPKPQFVTAQTSFSAPLHRFPWPTAPIRATAKADSEVIPIERTESGNWINVLYVGSTGHEILGWVEASKLNKVRLDMRSVNLMDLPISEFKYDSRQDIIDMGGAINKSRSGFMAAIIFTGIAIYACIMAAFFEWFTTPSYGLYRSSRSYTFTIVFAILSVLCLVWTSRTAGPQANERTFNLGDSWRGFASTKQKLNSIRRSKQNVTENIMEDQAKIAAMQIAGSLANTYLSKSMTNKQDVTVRYR